jgi:hypothetical protein
VKHNLKGHKRKTFKVSTCVWCVECGKQPSPETWPKVFIFLARHSLVTAVHVEYYLLPLLFADVIDCVSNQYHYVRCAIPYKVTGGNASKGIKSRDPNMSGIKNKTGTNERII